MTITDSVHRDCWAWLRFSIIGPLLAPPPAPRELRGALRLLAAKTWRHPVSSLDVAFGVSTLERWYYAARGANDPVAALKDRLRGDGTRFPSMAPQVTEALRTQYREHAGWTVQLHVDNLRATFKGGDIGMPSYPTIRRWPFIDQQAAQLSDRSADRRLHFALHLYYATGMRLIEGVNARVDDLRFVSYPDHESDEVIAGWELKVLGKGNKERIVQVPQDVIDVIDELASYLASRGLDPDLEAISNRGAYLLGQVVDVASRAPWSPRAQQMVDPKAGISPVTMYEAIKRFFKHCAEQLAATDPKGVERLASSSTHWMRHTYGTHAVAAGMPLDVVQQNMGHVAHEGSAGGMEESLSYDSLNRMKTAGMELYDSPRSRTFPKEQIYLLLSPRERQNSGLEGDEDTGELTRLLT